MAGPTKPNPLRRQPAAEGLRSDVLSKCLQAYLLGTGSAQIPAGRLQVLQLLWELMRPKETVLPQSLAQLLHRSCCGWDGEGVPSQ